MSTKKRYVILTPFDRADVVASIAYLHNYDVDVARAESGVVLVHDIPIREYSDWDISELLGDDPDTNAHKSEEPETAAEKSGDDENGLAVAQTFSQLSRYGVILFQIELGDDVGSEEGISGLVRAQRVLNGKAGEEIPAGLLINSLDPALEELVLGLKPINEVDPHVIRSADAGDIVHAMMEKSETDTDNESADRAHQHEEDSQ